MKKQNENEKKKATKKFLSPTPTTNRKKKIFRPRRSQEGYESIAFLAPVQRQTRMEGNWGPVAAATMEGNGGEMDGGMVTRDVEEEAGGRRSAGWARQKRKNRRLKTTDC